MNTLGFTAMKLDTYLQVGHPVRMAIGIFCTVFFMVLSVAQPEHKYISLLLVMIGLVGLYRDWMSRQKKA